MAIEFVNEPPKPHSTHRSGKHAGIAAKLRARPGEWALILRAASPTIAEQIRKGGLVAFRPAGAYEAVSRRNGNASAKRVEIYARYVGGGESPTPRKSSKTKPR